MALSRGEEEKPFSEWGTSAANTSGASVASGPKFFLYIFVCNFVFVTTKSSVVCRNESKKDARRLNRGSVCIKSVESR